MATSAFPPELGGGHRWLNTRRQQVRDGAVSRGLLPVPLLVYVVQRRPVPFVRVAVLVLEKGYQSICGRA